MPKYCAFQALRAGRKALSLQEKTLNRLRRNALQSWMEQIRVSGVGLSELRAELTKSLYHKSSEDGVSLCVVKSDGTVWVCDSESGDTTRSIRFLTHPLPEATPALPVKRSQSPFQKLGGLFCKPGVKAPPAARPLTRPAYPVPLAVSSPLMARKGLPSAVVCCSAREGVGLWDSGLKQGWTTVPGTMLGVIPAGERLQRCPEPDAEREIDRAALLLPYIGPRTCMGACFDTSVPEDTAGVSRKGPVPTVVKESVPAAGSTDAPYNPFTDPNKKKGQADKGNTKGKEAYNPFTDPMKSVKSGVSSPGPGRGAPIKAVRFADQANPSPSPSAIPTSLGGEVVEARCVVARAFLHTPGCVSLVPADSTPPDMALIGVFTCTLERVHRVSENTTSWRVSNRSTRWVRLPPGFTPLPEGQSPTHNVGQRERTPGKETELSHPQIMCHVGSGGRTIWVTVNGARLCDMCMVVLRSANPYAHTDKGVGEGTSAREFSVLSTLSVGKLLADRLTADGRLTPYTMPLTSDSAAADVFRTMTGPGASHVDVPLQTIPSHRIASMAGTDTLCMAVSESGYGVVVNSCGIVVPLRQSALFAPLSDTDHAQSPAPASTPAPVSAPRPISKPSKLVPTPAPSPGFQLWTDSDSGSGSEDSDDGVFSGTSFGDVDTDLPKSQGTLPSPKFTPQTTTPAGGVPASGPLAATLSHSSAGAAFSGQHGLTRDTAAIRGPDVTGYMFRLKNTDVLAALNCAASQVAAYATSPDSYFCGPASLGLKLSLLPLPLTPAQPDTPLSPPLSISMPSASGLRYCLSVTAGQGVRLYSMAVPLQGEGGNAANTPRELLEIRMLRASLNSYLPTLRCVSLPHALSAVPYLVAAAVGTGESETLPFCAVLASWLSLSSSGARINPLSVDSLVPSLSLHDALSLIGESDRGTTGTLSKSVVAAELERLILCVSRQIAMALLYSNDVDPSLPPTLRGDQSRTPALALSLLKVITDAHTGGDTVRDRVVSLALPVVGRLVLSLLLAMTGTESEGGRDSAEVHAIVSAVRTLESITYVSSKQLHTLSLFAVPTLPTTTRAKPASATSTTAELLNHFRRPPARPVLALPLWAFLRSTGLPSLEGAANAFLRRRVSTSLLVRRGLGRSLVMSSGVKEREKEEREAYRVMLQRYYVCAFVASRLGVKSLSTALEDAFSEIEAVDARLRQSLSDVSIPVPDAPPAVSIGHRVCASIADAGERNPAVDAFRLLSKGELDTGLASMLAGSSAAPREVSDTEGVREGAVKSEGDPDCARMILQHLVQQGRLRDAATTLCCRYLASDIGALPLVTDNDKSLLATTGAASVPSTRVLDTVLNRVSAAAEYLQVHRHGMSHDIPPLPGQSVHPEMDTDLPSGTSPVRSLALVPRNPSLIPALQWFCGAVFSMCAEKPVALLPLQLSSKGGVASVPKDGAHPVVEPTQLQESLNNIPEAMRGLYSPEGAALLMAWSGMPTLAVRLLLSSQRVHAALSLAHSLAHEFVYPSTTGREEGGRPTLVSVLVRSEISTGASESEACAAVYSRWDTLSDRLREREAELDGALGLGEDHIHRARADVSPSVNKGGVPMEGGTEMKTDLERVASVARLDAPPPVQTETGDLGAAGTQTFNLNGIQSALEQERERERASWDRDAADPLVVTLPALDSTMPALSIPINAYREGGGQLEVLSKDRGALPPQTSPTVSSSVTSLSTTTSLDARERERERELEWQREMERQRETDRKKDSVAAYKAQAEVTVGPLLPSPTLAYPASSAVHTVVPPKRESISPVVQATSLPRPLAESPPLSPVQVDERQREVSARERRREETVSPSRVLGMDMADEPSVEMGPVEIPSPLAPAPTSEATTYPTYPEPSIVPPVSTAPLAPMPVYTPPQSTSRAVRQAPSTGTSQPYTHTGRPHVFRIGGGTSGTRRPPVQSAPPRSRTLAPTQPATTALPRSVGMANPLTRSVPGAAPVRSQSGRPHVFMRGRRGPAMAGGTRGMAPSSSVPTFQSSHRGMDMQRERDMQYPLPRVSLFARHHAPPPTLDRSRERDRQRRLQREGERERAARMQRDAEVPRYEGEMLYREPRPVYRETERRETRIPPASRERVRSSRRSERGRDDVVMRAREIDVEEGQGGLHMMGRHVGFTSVIDESVSPSPITMAPLDLTPAVSVTPPQRREETPPSKLRIEEEEEEVVEEPQPAKRRLNMTAAEDKLSKLRSEFAIRRRPPQIKAEPASEASATESPPKPPVSPLRSGVRVVDVETTQDMQTSSAYLPLSPNTFLQRQLAVLRQPTYMTATRSKGLGLPSKGADRKGTGADGTEGGADAGTAPKDTKSSIQDRMHDLASRAEGIADIRAKIQALTEQMEEEGKAEDQYPEADTVNYGETAPSELNSISALSVQSTYIPMGTSHGMGRGMDTPTGLKGIVPLTLELKHSESSLMRDADAIAAQIQEKFGPGAHIADWTDLGPLPVVSTSPNVSMSLVLSPSPAPSQSVGGSEARGDGRADDEEDSDSEWRGILRGVRTFIGSTNVQGSPTAALTRTLADRVERLHLQRQQEKETAASQQQQRERERESAVSVEMRDDVSSRVRHSPVEEEADDRGHFHTPPPRERVERSTPIARDASLSSGVLSDISSSVPISED
ncbi:hypothetical protein KIPB_002180 [Kipferlia bialata]|uniref:Uncharacterized protein n=1 Tax=Kipferlia bialata TaxID=797122 RepID=A0A9K3GGG7_9EUKA|nr:hypothetical protein KIPB_002180 [Kipferlia bialata]|eukprot:g2180.t1